MLALITDNFKTEPAAKNPRHDIPLPTLKNLRIDKLLPKFIMSTAEMRLPPTEAEDRTDIELE
jgi:hypothetical protein